MYHSVVIHLFSNRWIESWRGYCIDALDKKETRFCGRYHKRVLYVAVILPMHRDIVEQLYEHCLHATDILFLQMGRAILNDCKH